MVRNESYSAINDEGYTYDANDNRTNTGYQTGTGNNNQLSSDGTYNYTYDNEGNLKTRTEIATGKVREFTWDYRNRLTGVADKTGGTVTQQVSYTYDGLNQRLAKTVGSQTTRFVYDRGHVYLEFSGTSTTPSTRYLYGPMVDQVLAQESNGQTTWMLTDHLGSVRDLVNNSGAVVNHFTYDSFGQVVGSTGTVDTRYKFTGREYDSETGLYYYRARYFDAGVGRFIGQDPIGFGAGDSNLYRYVGNSPFNATDPSGNLEVEVVFNSLGSLSPQTYIRGTTIPGMRRKVSTDHAFIRVTDKDCPYGLPYAYRGGPTNDFGSLESLTKGFGIIKAQYGVYSGDTKNRRYDKFPDWKNEKQPSVSVDARRYKSWSELDGKFKQTINFINQSNIPYNMFGPNSNTVVTQLLTEAKLPIPARPAGIDTRGWGMNLWEFIPSTPYPGRVPSWNGIK